MGETFEAGAQGAVPTPRHVWIVGVVSLMWNAMGAVDYTMTETRNPAYLKMMDPAQMAWVANFPAWAVGAWALGVWGAVAGSVLLLMRNRHAVTAFIISLVGLAGTTLFTYVVSPPPAQYRGAANLGMTAALWAIAIGLLLYSRSMRARGVLR